MKKLILPLLFCLCGQLCFSQSFPKKQTLIPLSNVNGVPFFKAADVDDIGINGFEVDAKGNFYFFGGEGHGCLVCFNGSKQVYRKNYDDLAHGGELYLFKYNLYSATFVKKGDPVYLKINSTNGSVDKIGPSFEAFWYSDKILIDSCLLVEVTDGGGSKVHYEQYLLTGKLVKKASKITEIRPLFFPVSGGYSTCSFVGEWSGKYVFYGNSDLNAPFYLWLVDKNGKVLAKRAIPKNLTGKGYFEEPDEDRKVRNGSFFVLGRKGNNALITEIPLQTFFYK